MLRGPYRDDKGWRIRWTDPRGNRHTKRHKTLAAANAHVAKIRGDAPPPPDTSLPTIEDAPPPQAAATPDRPRIPTHEDWVRILTQALVEARAIGEPAQRARVIASLATAAKPYLDIVEQIRGAERAVVILRKVQLVDRSDLGRWAVGVSAVLVEALAADHSNSSLRAAARAIKSQVDTVVSAAKRSELEDRVARLTELVDEWQAVAEHGTEFLGVRGIAAKNAAAAGDGGSTQH